MKLGILRLRLSRGLDARRCRLHRRRSVMPWWRRGSYATNDRIQEINTTTDKEKRLGLISPVNSTLNRLHFPRNYVITFRVRPRRVRSISIITFSAEGPQQKGESHKSKLIQRNYYHLPRKLLPLLARDRVVYKRLYRRSFQKALTYIKATTDVDI